MASADPKRIIVTESRCHACNDHTFVVHHQTFPELRMEAMSAERAARYVANRLEDAIHIVADAVHREAVRLAIDDLRAFVDREVAIRLGRDVHGHPIRS